LKIGFVFLEKDVKPKNFTELKPFLAEERQISCQKKNK